MVDTTTDANINSESFSIQTAASAKRAVVTELPIIDISPFLNDSTVAERRRVAAQLHRASVLLLLGMLLVFVATRRSYYIFL